MKEPRLAQKIGGAAFGLLFGFIVSSAVKGGAGFIFEPREVWDLPFWGGHYITLVIGQLVGFWIGGFVAGCIAKNHGSYWGIISTLPRVIVWIYLIGRQIGYGDLYWWTGDWIVAILLVTVTPFVAYHAGKLGQKTRIENEEFFEARKGTLLGIKWYHWLWFFFPINMAVMLATYSVYHIILFLTVILRSLLWFFFVGLLMEPLLFGSIYLLGLSVHKTYMLLSTGYKMGFNRSQIAKRVLWWTVGIYLIVGGMQTLANLVMRL